jgi:hypothetical protein
MIFHFVQEIEGIGKIEDGYNPATWILEVTTVTQEFVLGVDFSDIYKNSELYQFSNLLALLVELYLFLNSELFVFVFLVGCY